MLEKQADSRSLSFPLLSLASWGIYLFYMQLVISPAHLSWYPVSRYSPQQDWFPPW